MLDYLNSALFDLKRSAIREFNRMARETPGCISLTLGEPDFNTPDPVKAAAKKSLDLNETHYIENNGSKALREAIAEFERGHSHTDYTPEEIIVTVGATEGLFTALFGIINPGDEVIVPTPAFGLYESIITMCRGVFVPLDTSKNGFQITQGMLEGAITDKTKAIIINTPNNPTGCILNQDSLSSVRKAVSGRPIFVITDDVYNQLVYTDDYSSLAAEKELRSKLIVIQSFSKPYAMTGWRAGYMMCDRAIKERLELVHQFTVVSSSSISQRACIEALAWDPHEMRDTYRRRRDYTYNRLISMGLDVVKPQGAFYAFPSISRFGMSSTEFCTRMVREGKVAAVPGVCFEADDHIRLSYCCADEKLEEGLNRIESFIRGI